MKVKKFVNSGYHLGYRYIKKSRGPNIDPWGIPTVTGIISDLHGFEVSEEKLISVKIIE